MANRWFQFNAGLGGGGAQSLRKSLGVNFYPFKRRFLTPYLGVDYAFGLGTTLGKEEAEELYSVGFHQYACPYLAVKVKSWTEEMNFKLKVGYSQLLNQPNVRQLGQSGDGYANILSRIESHWMIVVGICGNLYR